MSTRILLPCSPPPHRPAERPVAPLGRAPALISLGPFSSYAACQVPASKTPLLKTRRATPSPGFPHSTPSPGFPHSTSENGLSFTPAGVGIHLREVTASLRNHSPTRQVLLTHEGSPLKATPPPPVPSRRPRLEEVYQLPDGGHDLRKPSLPPNSRLPSRKTSVSSSSSSPLSPLSPLSPGGALFSRRLPSPSTPKILLKKSQSALIMPSLLTLLRPDTAPSAPPQRDGPDFPSPLIRKCQTMVSLSGGGASDASTPSPSLSTKVVKERRGTARLGLLRRISSSKSAVFSSSASKSAVLRKSSSVAIHRYRKGSSVGMEPHPEHPDETKPPAAPSAHEREDGSRHSSGEDVTEPCSGLKERSPSHDEERVPLGGGCSRCTSVASLPSRRHSVVPSDGVFCKLCLSDVSVREMYQLQQCQCRFCTYCMCMHATLKIREGEPTIECPDSNCDCQGELTLDEVESLVGKELLNLHLRFRRDREIELDPLKTWCPKPSCDTVVCLSLSKLEGRPQCCSCPTCNTMFCGSCSSHWHPGKPCNHIVAQLLGVPLNESIKRCPRCKVPIERDAGCAQMQCKKCKHVFCWYCLASLEDDFLLRHYDKGPCKNKLGHSRASVLWHRAQVVVIFAGFGLLLVIASPLLLFVGPCLLCRSCRPCSTSRLDSDEEGNTGL